MSEHKEKKVTARAHANIALAKYWGKRDEELNLPFFDSVSINVEDLYTETTAVWNEEDVRDSLSINGWEVPAHKLGRIQKLLDEIRRRAGLEGYRCVLTSRNNFPVSTGLASSASGAAAAAMAASVSAGLSLNERELSQLARIGSGSAEDGSDFYASSLFGQHYWNLHIFAILVDTKPKRVSSTDGMLACQKSPFWNAYMETAKHHADAAQNAIFQKDFSLLREVVHSSTCQLHALAATASPAIFYLSPKSLEIIEHIHRQSQAIPVCCTLDAGSNVIVICEDVVYPFVKNDIIALGLPYIQSKVGGGTTII